MPFIKMDLDDVNEPSLAQEGEYDLRIVKAEDGESKSGNDMTSLLIIIEGAEGAGLAPIRHWLTYPGPDTPPEQKAMRLIDIKRFLTCFGIRFDEGGFDSDDLIGATGHCLVIQEKGDDGNTYNRLRPPRLKKSDERAERRIRGG
jgi:hypothetical protein